MSPLSIRRVSEPDRRCRFTARRTIVANVSPQASRLRLAVAWRQHRYRHIIAVQFLRAQHILLQRIHQRPQRPARSAHPIGQRRAVQINALPLIDLRLTVQRQMIGILRYQNMRQQTGPGQTAIDRTVRRQLLDDPGTARATQLRPHCADHFEACRDIFQRLRHVFARWRSVPPQSGQASCFGAIVSVSRGSAAGTDGAQACVETAASARR